MKRIKYANKRRPNKSYVKFSDITYKCVCVCARTYVFVRICLYVYIENDLCML